MLIRYERQLLENDGDDESLPEKCLFNSVFAATHKQGMFSWTFHMSGANTTEGRSQHMGWSCQWKISSLVTSRFVLAHFFHSGETKYTQCHLVNSEVVVFLTLLSYILNYLRFLWSKDPSDGWVVTFTLLYNGMCVPLCLHDVPRLRPIAH